MPLRRSARAGGRPRLALAAWLWVLALAVMAATPGVAGETKAAASAPRDERAGQDLDDLRRRIRETERDLAATEESRTEAADALKKSEQAISEATRTLRELNQREAATQATMAQLAAAQSASHAAIGAGQARLAALLRHQYAAGGDDALALLLSGDDPARLARDTEYLRRLTLARESAVAGLRDQLSRLAALDQQAQVQADQLAHSREARARERRHLQEEGSTHARTVAELSSRLQAQKRSLETMQRDEKRLTELVERIAKALEERRRLKEKAQRERAERAERERAQRDKAARAAATAAAGRERKPGEGRAGGEPAPAEGAAPDGGETAKRPPVIARIDESAEEGYDTEAFPRMKGRLRLPVTGELANRFASPREDSGLNWKGLFIRAPQGREVHAVATGRVVFSDWLRGFGNLLIIDHGAGYMSLYGNNEALFARVGELVKGGMTVAAVGNSGGNPEPGLYFELRYQSRPFDPMSWVGRP